jgi:hypothetical protein
LCSGFFYAFVGMDYKFAKSGVAQSVMWRLKREIQDKIDALDGAKVDNGELTDASSGINLSFNKHNDGNKTTFRQLMSMHRARTVWGSIGCDGDQQTYEDQA